MNLSRVLVAAVILAGCTSTPEYFVAPAKLLRNATYERPPTRDDYFAAVAASEVPGFAGFYIEGSSVVVNHSQPFDEAKAGAFLLAHAEEWGIDPRATLIFRPVRYAYDSLNSWLDVALLEMGKANIHMIDLDEVTNQIMVGVSKAEQVEEARSSLMASGIPDEAIRVDVVAPMEFRSTLHDRMRPAQGGIQILAPDITWTVGQCTLGVVAKVGPSVRWLTASHCTVNDNVANTWHPQFDGQEILQPDGTVADSLLGFEIADPTCYIFGLCRRSDAALLSFVDASGDLGRIARTLYAGSANFGSDTIDVLHPYFEITGKHGLYTQGPVGERLDKVGQVSGWTTGTVTQTCFYSGGVSCAWATSNFSTGGDSGSPVFYLTPGLSVVAFYGILFGGPSGNSFISYHSPVQGIETDLGVTLKVCVAPYTC